MLDSGAFIHATLSKELLENYVSSNLERCTWVTTNRVIWLEKAQYELDCMDQYRG